MMGSRAPSEWRVKESMVTHGGRCPYCEKRTTPGVGKRAGQWICTPCQLILDNYGQVLSGPEESMAPRPGIVVLPRPGQVRRKV